MGKLWLWVGRTALASLFMLGGINKIVNYEGTLSAMAEVGLNPASLLLPLTILLEICGALILILGRFKVHYVAIGLALFTLATNWFFHDFWNMSGDVMQLERSLFFKNIAIAGGLIFLAGHHNHVTRI